MSSDAESPPFRKLWLSSMTTSPYAPQFRRSRGSPVSDVPRVRERSVW